MGENNIVFGSDSPWYGGPQWQIEALWRSQIPEDMRDRWDYPELDEDAKRKILGLNSARLYGLKGNESGNCHGWQNDRPPIASTVESFRLMLADGRIVRCSRTENAELFAVRGRLRRAGRARLCEALGMRSRARVARTSLIRLLPSPSFVGSFTIAVTCLLAPGPSRAQTGAVENAIGMEFVRIPIREVLTGARPATAVAKTTRSPRIRMIRRSSSPA